ncbi:MAG: hypothetical protein MZV64_18205 [Ignavibacteriales bacterium]|nr:hypothetical protein [Ignavibacteriales bacterium]
MRKGQLVTNIAPDFASKRWLGPARRDRRGPLPAHLPLPDRHPLQVRRPDAGQAHARLPLDDRLRRLHPGAALRPEARRHRVGLPGLRGGRADPVRDRRRGST